MANEEVVELPRPYRRDAGGHPSSALEIEEFRVYPAGSGLHYTFRSSVNRYEPIPAGKLFAKVFLNHRDKKAFFSAGYTVPVVHLQEEPIPTGGRWILTGTIEVPDDAPSQHFDRVGLALRVHGHTRVSNVQAPAAYCSGCVELPDSNEGAMNNYMRKNAF